jgi:hypothetical protein
MQNSKRILICPLNWGLGHAVRCVPIIRHLQKDGKEVIIAADGYPLELLKKEFPELRFIDFASYKIKYGKGKSQVFAMLKCVPSILLGIRKEHKQLKKIIATYKVDCVLSDNRFGLYNKKIKSIYMTHQLMIKMPRKLTFLEPLAWRIHRFFINKYDICLIPDELENGGFAGDLAHKYSLPKNAKFIGILSRFSLPYPLKEGLKVPFERFRDNYQIIAVISGIEPQRTIFEKTLIEELSKKEIYTLIVRGLPEEEQKMQKIGKVDIVSHLSSEEIKHYLLHTPTVICRSGYSSVMDLATLNKTAVLVPTPGQTEQEYLADYLSKKNRFQCVKQEYLREFIQHANGTDLIDLC